MKGMGAIVSHLVLYFHFLDNGLGIMAQQMWVDYREETRNRIGHKICTTKSPKKVRLALLWYDQLLKYKTQGKCWGVMLMIDWKLSDNKAWLEVLEDPKNGIWKR